MTDEILEQFTSFLERVLPDDYDENYAQYRHDRALRTRFQAALYDEGWLVPEWPRELGGRELSLPDALAVRIEGARRRIPRQMNIQAVGVVAPAILRFGTPEQIDTYLRPTLRGEAWWALGMSEPESGSDLASLRTTAKPVDGGYLVNGQKVWTTQADESRWCTLYVRTDPDAPKHKGITCLLLDMSSPGITTRLIRTADPAVESFCEVFLDDVFVPDTDVLGEVNGGWAVAMSSLEHERDMIWINNWLEMQRALDPVLSGAPLAPHELEQLGRHLADTEAIRLTGLRSVANRMAGRDDALPGILKLFGSESVQRAALFAAQNGVDSDVVPVPRFEEYFESLAATIYGGTSEIQRNIIAERILGLPKG